MSTAWKLRDATIAAKCLKLFEEGVSAACIAERLGIHRTAVNRNVVVARRDRDLSKHYADGRKDERAFLIAWIAEQSAKASIEGDAVTAASFGLLADRLRALQS